MKHKEIRKIGQRRSRSAQPAGGRFPIAYFYSLELQGARCFSEKQKLDISDDRKRPARWTILLGNNGTGKTTLLQSLLLIGDLAKKLTNANLMKKYIVNFSYIYDNIEKWFARNGERPLQFTLTMAAGIEPLKIIEDLEYISYFCRARSGFSALRTGPTIPLCCAYGAGRRLGTSSLSDQISDDPTLSLFSNDAELRNAEEWLLQVDYSASKKSAVQSRQKRRLEQVKRLLIDILPDVSEIHFVAPTMTQPNPGVEFETPYGRVPLRRLGYGYQTLIAWMVDLASRMVEYYPDSADPLSEPAIVLVDEIDLHLHPKWQRDLIAYLTDRFPNTQFIATAHSPLIVQAAVGANANIAVLKREGDHVVIESGVEAVRGWRIDQILTSDLFGLPSARPPELDKPLARRKQLLTKSRLTKAEREELADLDAEIGTLPFGETDEQARRMMDLVAETQRLLQERPGRKQ